MSAYRYFWLNSLASKYFLEAFVMGKAPSFSLFRYDEFDKECREGRNFIKHKVSGMVIWKKTHILLYGWKRLDSWC